MKLAEVYKKSLKKKWLVRLKTKYPDNGAYNGVVLKETKDFVVLCVEYDLEWNGMLILAKKFISGFRDGKFEKTLNAILHHSGQIRKVSLPKWLVKCETFEDVFKNCLKRKVWPCVEILFKERKLKSAFFVGKVINGNENQVFFQSYDATGEWEKEWVIEFKEILSVGFNDSYTTHFNAFMRAKDKK